MTVREAKACRSAKPPSVDQYSIQRPNFRYNDGILKRINKVQPNVCASIYTKCHYYIDICDPDAVAANVGSRRIQVNNHAHNDGPPSILFRNRLS